MNQDEQLDIHHREWIKSKEPESLYEQDDVTVETIAAIEKKGDEWFCFRCHNQNRSRFAKLYKQDVVYCRDCLTFGRVTTESQLIRSQKKNHHVSKDAQTLNMNKTLSALQEKASNAAIKAFDQRVNHYTWAVCGAGKTEIANVLYGVDEFEGTVKINGKEANIKNPTQAIENGLALVPEERRTEGLCTMLSICDNTPMMNYKTVSSGGILSQSKMNELADMYIKKVVVACRDSAQVIAFLSGGNQQKVVISKCLNSNPEIILLDEPTRGVDVGAKQEIYALIRELSEQGRSVIVFSSELPEILNICDRVGLLYDGSLQEIIQNGDDVDSQHIMNIVTGGV